MVFSDDLKSVEHFILCLLAICILIFGEMFGQFLRVCVCVCVCVCVWFECVYVYACALTDRHVWSPEAGIRMPFSVALHFIF